MVTQLSASKLEAMIWCTRFTYWSAIAGLAKEKGDLTSYVIAKMGAQNAIKGLKSVGVKQNEMLMYVDELDKQLQERKADNARPFDQAIDGN